MGEHFKVEIIKDLGDDVSIYYQGDWFDLCRSPHVQSTGQRPLNCFPWPGPTGEGTKKTHASAHLRDSVR